MQPRDGTTNNHEPPPPLWLVAVMLLLGLGILAAAVAFLYHAFFGHRPHGTPVVNPVFSVLMLVAGGAGLYAGGAAVFRRFVPARPTPPPVSPPPPPPPVEARPAPAWQGRLLHWLLWLAGAELKLWLLSLFLVGWGAWELYRQEREVGRWQQTDGVILEARVVVRYRSLRANPPRPPLVPRVRYRYGVGGRSFEGIRVTTGDPPVFSSTDEANAFLACHRVGETVPVRYRPEAPDQATLTVSRDGGGWLLLGFGVPTLLLTAYLSWKRRGRSEPDIDVSVLA